MLIEGKFPVAAPPQALIGYLLDARLMASCLPGCESLEPLPGDRYRAVVAIALAGIKARFNLQVEITRKDESNVWAVTRGEEGGNASSLHADSQVSLQPSAEGTLVSYRSEVSVTGRLGRFGLGMMKKKAQSMGDEFAANLRAKLESLGDGAAARQEPPPQPSPRGGGSEAQPSLRAGGSEAQPSPGAGGSEAADGLLARWWRKLLGFLRGGHAQSESRR